MIVDGITGILLILLFIAIIFVLSYSASQNTHRLTGKALSTLSDSFEIFENVKLKAEGSKSFIIDYVVMNKKGIYLVKVEDRKGTITGDEAKAKWKESIKTNTEEFDNPIKNILLIINTMKNELDGVASKIPMYPIVVFHRNANLTNLFTDALAVTVDEIKAYIKNDEEVISNKQFDKLKKKLILMGQLKTHVA